MSIFKRIKIKRNSDFSFLDNLSQTELNQFIKQTQEEVDSLWEKEKSIRENGGKELFATTLKRQEKLSQSVMSLSAAKKKAQGAGDGFITGKIEYGEESTSLMALTKVAFNTQYDICSDEVENFSDYKRFWILEDGGKYYHWLKERKNTNDYLEHKPNPIPITFASTDTISLKATFKVTSQESFTSTPSVRATDKSGKYLFNTVTGKTNGEFEITFKSMNKPFENTIQYIPSFEILFEYSQDNGETWQSAGSCITTLYVTWGRPKFSQFKLHFDEVRTMQLANKSNGKNCIIESLLWLGCFNAKGLGNQQLSEYKDSLVEKNEECIIDAIFKPFTTKKVLRVREGSKYCTKDWSDEGLDYWRGKSAQGLSTEDPQFGALRSLRYLLRVGEACCGEWKDLFLHLLLTQGIIVSESRDSIAICTDYARKEVSFFKDNYIYTSALRNKSIQSIQFSVVEAQFVIRDNEIVIDGQSAGQGNHSAQPFFMDHVWVYLKGKRFFDPSYGLCYSEQNSNLSKYCKDNITSVVIESQKLYSIQYNDTHISLNSSVKTNF